METQGESRLPHVLVVTSSRLFADALDRVCNVESVTQASPSDGSGQPAPDVALIDLTCDATQSVDGAVECDRTVVVGGYAQQLPDGIHCDAWLPADTTLDRLLATLNGDAAPTAIPALTDADSDDPLSVLTSREREVLAELAQGADTKRLADRLSISSNTVRSHVQSVLDKLGVDSRAQAVALALRHHNPSDLVDAAVVDAEAAR